MSSIRNISSSNIVPSDIAQKLGTGGVNEIIEVMWLAFHDLKESMIITVSDQEDAITQEWYIKLHNRWTSENRAARLTFYLTPINQYSDDTMAKSRRKSPVIDFCFRSWDKNDGYFGAECKNLYAGNRAKTIRYVEKGVKHFVSGYYGSKSSVSAMIGYILSGTELELANELLPIIGEMNPIQNLGRELLVPNPQYKSIHIRTSDKQHITVHHLLFGFTS